ncbi:hypothetical protein [Pseudomonas viridiflava]|uniref:hypothetical protein n=1 Tax=Pseudomonas viridiflava TaxID=33069 RepID=UPI000F057F8C|nr:hypothetical protein [Pseudomonas viridiflava]
MKKLGSVKYTKGAISVVELIETYLDGTTELLGYVLTGPGADSTWMYSSLGDAIAAADELDPDTRPSRTPRMGM